MLLTTNHQPFASHFNTPLAAARPLAKHAVNK
jgi:hypothetical protein